MLIIVGVLLSIPLIAMQFTAEVNWSLADFAIMAAMLLGLGLVIELLLRRVKRKKHRLILGAIAVLLFLLTWAELAVGIIGTPFAGD